MSAIDSKVAAEITREFLESIGATEELEMRGFYGFDRRFRMRGDVPGYLMDHALNQLVDKVYAQALSVATVEAKRRIQRKIKDHLATIVEQVVR